MAGAHGRRWKSRSKPCSVCRKWFTPHPRVGKRQKTCGSADCRHELHQRARRVWREKHPDYDRERRLRRQILAKPGAGAEPIRQLDWRAVREVVELEVAVTIEEASQMTLHMVREVVRAQVLAIKGKARQVLPRVPREEIAARPPPP